MAECEDQLKKMRDDYEKQDTDESTLDRLTALLKGLSACFISLHVLLSCIHFSHSAGIQTKLTTMKLRERLIVDGGWNGGKEDSGRVMYIVEKTQQEQKDAKTQRIIVKDVFSFVIANVGKGACFSVRLVRILMLSYQDHHSVL